MEKYLALRAQKLVDLKNALKAIDCDILNTQVERIEPALRNMAEGLHRRGMVYDIAGHGVFWVRVNDERSVESYSEYSAVECAFSVDWFKMQAQKVRYLRGIAYCDATEAWGDDFPLADQTRSIDLQFLKPDRVPEISAVMLPESAIEFASVPTSRAKRVTESSVDGEASAVPVVYELKESMSLDLEPEGHVGARSAARKSKPRPAFRKRDKIEEEQLDIFATGS